MSRTTIYVYPTEEQRRTWKKEAEELDMSISEYMQSMTIAGRKKFDASVERDETDRELRERRNALKHELEAARDRINTLEQQLETTERAEVADYIQTHPGATFPDIVQHLIETVPQRVNRHLDDLAGESIRTEGDAFYPMDTDSNGEKQ